MLRNGRLHDDMKTQKKTSFWVQFYSLPCLVIASSGWKKYFMKYFSGTSVKLLKKSPKNQEFVTINIIDTKGDTNHITFNAVYDALTCTITTRALDHSVFPMISNVLQRLFTRLIYRQGGLVLHASAVRHDEKAYLFIGHSGAGKTTAAKISMANGHEVIADNFVFIIGRQDAYSVLPFPFDQFHNRKNREAIQLRHVYVLQKSSEISFIPILGMGKWIALQRFGQIQTPHVAKGFSLNPKILFDFVHSVTMYTLKFTKSDNFWDKLP